MPPTNDTPPRTPFNPGGQRFFAAVVGTDPHVEGDDRPRLMYPHPGYSDYEVYEWLSPGGYQPVAIPKGSPNAGDSLTLALDMATWLNDRYDAMATSTPVTTEDPHRPSAPPIQP